MGIKDLLPALKQCTEHCHISQFRGQKIAVDGFVWLHKASYYCSKDLFLDPGTDKIIPYLFKRLKLLLDNELEPFFVFDGRALPIKDNTNDSRRQIRQQATEKIMKLIREGREDQITTTDYNSAVSIKYETVKNFIKLLRTMHVSYIVAPYEADAQLAYLARAGFVDLVLTEDSDLIAYGTPQVLFKLNINGNVDSIKTKDAIALFNFNDQTSRKPSNQGKKNQKKNQSLTPKSTDFSTFTQIKEIPENDYNDFLTFCILTGCDYAPHIKYVGPKAAISLVRENHSSIDDIIKKMSLNKRVIVPPNYKQDFERAKLTFMHQKVYNIDLKKVVPLAPLFKDKKDFSSIDDFDFEFAGKIFKGKKLSQHIKGEIDSHHNEENKNSNSNANDNDYDEDDDDEEEDQKLTSKSDDDDEDENEFDDSEINEYFLPFTRGYKKGPKSEIVIPQHLFKPNKKNQNKATQNKTTQNKTTQNIQNQTTQNQNVQNTSNNYDDDEEYAGLNYVLRNIQRHQQGRPLTNTIFITDMDEDPNAKHEDKPEVDDFMNKFLADDDEYDADFNPEDAKGVKARNDPLHDTMFGGVDFNLVQSDDEIEEEEEENDNDDTQLHPYIGTVQHPRPY